MSLNWQKRFDEKWIPEPNSGCWLWIRALTNKGYGLTRSPAGRGAHRASWLIHRGEIPDGMCVLHRCDTPPCVNPDHLFLGTHTDNAQDKKKKGRSNTPLGSDSGPSKLMESDVSEIRRLRMHGMRQLEIANMFGITRSNVSYIVNGRTWRHVS